MRIAGGRGKRHGRLGAVGNEEDFVQLYLNDIGRHPLLTKEDEVCLGVVGRSISRYPRAGSRTERRVASGGVSGAP